MGKSAAANWAGRWARGGRPDPLLNNNQFTMTSGGGGAKSPDSCENCGHANPNRNCECCRGGCR